MLVPTGLTYSPSACRTRAHIEASGPAEGACFAREHAGEAPRAPKLIDVVRDALRARHYSRRTVQELLGHRDVTTTMIYTHVLNRGPGAVRSPADLLVKGSADQPRIAIDDVRSHPRYTAAPRSLTPPRGNTP